MPETPPKKLSQQPQLIDLVNRIIEAESKAAIADHKLYAIKKANERIINATDKAMTHNGVYHQTGKTYYYVLEENFHLYIKQRRAVYELANQIKVLVENVPTPETDTTKPEKTD